MTKYIAIYTRVSSKSQDTKSQLPDLERWGNSQESQIKWFTDKFTGKSMQRDGWKRLQAAIETGEVSAVVCWRLDRLGRTAAGLTKLFDELREKKINLISLKDGLDLSTSAGRLMANVLASVAQYETEVRLERVLAGQAAARAEGKAWGGSKKGRRIWVKPEQVRIVRQMRNEPKAAIARATGLSRVTVYRLLAELEPTAT